MSDDPKHQKTDETASHRRAGHWVHQKRTHNKQKLPRPQARRCHKSDPGRRRIQLPPAPQMDQVPLGLFAVAALPLLHGKFA